MLRRLITFAALVVLITISFTSFTSFTHPLSAQEPEPETPVEIQEFDVPTGARPHDVAPAPDGWVWYTAQRQGALGKLNPATGEYYQIPLGAGSAPHGVIVGPAGDAWVTDGGLNAMVRVAAATEAVTVYPLPQWTGYANLNTAAFDRNGVVWFTGQSGIYGRLDPATDAMEVWNAPRGRGPYGIAATPDGDIFYASLAGNYVGQVDIDTGEVMVLDPSTRGQGARRVWSDSTGRIWVSEWNVGQLSVYTPADGSWQTWPLPGATPSAYAVYVDEHDLVWVSDFGGNAMHVFDPATETFTTYPLPSAGGNIRQILGRPGEIWGAESGVDKLIVFRTGAVAESDEVTTRVSLVQLVDPLDEPEFYCVDVPGFGASLNLSGALTAHTCKPGADDELFAVADAGTTSLSMPAYDLCLQAERADAEATLVLAACEDADALQTFTHTETGYLQLSDTDWCIAVEDAPGRPTGGPSHVVRSLSLQPCASTALALAQWTFPGTHP